MVAAWVPSVTFTNFRAPPHSGRVDEGVLTPWHVRDTSSHTGGNDDDQADDQVKQMTGQLAKPADSKRPMLHARSRIWANATGSLAHRG